MRMATCHTDKPHQAHGLCKTCYERDRKSKTKIMAKCHPERKHLAHGLCSSCVMREWRKENISRSRETNKRYRLLHPERIKASKKKYLDKNRNPRIIKIVTKEELKERGRKYGSQYYYKHHSEVLERKKLYHKKYKNRDAQYGRKRRAILAGATVIATANERESRRKIFDGSCAYCGKDAKTLDHVIAITKNGGDHAGNIILACDKCNKSKNNKDWITWYRGQLFYDPKREKFISDNIW